LSEGNAVVECAVILLSPSAFSSTSLRDLSIEFTVVSWV